MAEQNNQSQNEKWLGRFSIGAQPIFLLLEASPQGLLSCSVVGDAQAEALGEYPAEPVNPHLKAAVSQLEEYFAGKRQHFEVTLAPAGTAFQQKAWAAAREIPFGQTRSYWWVAVRLGDPRTARAVGGAMGANPLLLFTPCHRVVRQDNSLGGFSGGIGWKIILLEHEKQFLQDIG